MRNGIEVVHSMQNFHGFAHMSFKQCCERWANSLASFKYLETMEGAAVLTHHDMVSKPQDTLNGVFDKLGMAEGTPVADYISSTFFNSSFEETNQPFDFNSRMQAAWDDWGDGKRKQFMDTCGAKMTEYAFHMPQELSV